MSALAGILHFDSAPSQPGLIEALAAAMKRRGPDEQTHWVKGSVALGHCMLRTTPESRDEHQPLASRDDGLVLVWDGRLDNRDELKRELVSAGTTPRDNTDAELALQSYATWGEDSPRRLLGDFALAVWDAHQQRLFCAVDHMGARPFYYVHNRHFFAFASEEEALLELPGVARQPNEAMILHMLVPAYDSADNQRFWLQDVWGLQPGQYMSVSADGASKAATYWRFEPGVEQAYASDHECREAFLDVFGKAVRCRMRSSGNIAAMMSGGMDSAGIAAMVKRLLPEMPGKQFHTYSAIADDPATCVESRCIQSLTKNLGENAHFVSVPSFTGMASVEDLIETTLSRPHPCDNSIVLPAMMCLAASRDGHRVMLHGANGDLVMNVPNRYPAYMLRNGQWRTAWDECRGAGHNNTYLHGASPTGLLLRSAWTAWMPSQIRFMARALQRLIARSEPDTNPLAQTVVNPAFANRLGLMARLHDQEADAAHPFHGNIRETQAKLLNAAWGPVLGLSGYDRIAGRYGTELRDPWSDRRVAEFFLTLPLKYKVRNGWNKYLARTAFAPDLEDSVRWRIGKEHLGWQFTVRFMDEIDPVLESILEHNLASMQEYVDSGALRARLKQYRYARNIADQEFFYQSLTLALWICRIKGNKIPSPKGFLNR